MKDWTIKNEESNDSDLYTAMVHDVNNVIIESASLLLAGGSQAVARQIVSRLAHIYKLSPNDDSDEIYNIKQNPKKRILCPECGVKAGEYHIKGCGKEICSDCGNRLGYRYHVGCARNPAIRIFWLGE